MRGRKHIYVSARGRAYINGREGIYKWEGGISDGLSRLLP